MAFLMQVLTIFKLCSHIEFEEKSIFIKHILAHHMIYNYLMGHLIVENKKSRVYSEDTMSEFAGSSSSQQAEECIYNLEKQNMEKSKKIDEL